MRTRLDYLLWIGATGLALTLTACGDGAPEKAAPPPPPSMNHATPTPPNPSYCPLANQLIRGQNLTWGAPGGWMSNTASFSSEINSFIGAQWQGLSNGTIMCVYKGNQEDFSISIQTNRFVEAPWGGMWQNLQLKEPEANDLVQKATYVINCVSVDPKDCPFPTTSYVWQAPQNQENSGQQNNGQQNNQQNPPPGSTPLSN